MKIIEDTGLSFEDVLLVPKRNAFGSRKLVSLKTRLTKGISLNLPIVSANMDTITGHGLAVAMAESGGIGIVHRFNTVEEEVAEVKRVKRHSSYIIDEPYTISSDKTIEDVKELTKATGVSGFPVVEGRRLVGIITSKDIKFQDDRAKVSDVMTKKRDLVTIRGKGSNRPSRDELVTLFRKHKIEKIPIVDRNFNLMALVAAKDIAASLNSETSRDRKGRLLVGAAIGVKSDAITRADRLLKAGADVLVIDVAHGHSNAVMDTLRRLKKEFDTDVIAGNVATREGVEDLVAAGADAVKVGIGPGHVCTTRLVTGAGVPQVTAIMWAYEAARWHNVPVISDGGINTSGDIVKALAAGASTVMVGRLFAGTEETPGATIIKGGKKYKFYRGMSSISANDKKMEVDRPGTELGDIVGEGMESFVPYAGSAVDLLKQLAGGLRSGFSYCGATNIEELRRNAHFVKLASGGQRESFVREQ